MRHILVLGGSYFVGRVFAMYAAMESDIRLHVVNRGHYPLHLAHVREYRCDRHNTAQLLCQLPNREFDAVVDFCAYQPGDISRILNCLSGRVHRYLYFSTASLYREDLVFPNETAPLTERFPPGQVGDYLRGKQALEAELAGFGQTLSWDILRPAYIYGPYNYAPRESWLIRQILQGRPVPFPVDATGRWSFVYVDDISRFLLGLLAQGRKPGQRIYNLAAPEQVSYPLLFRTLELGCGGAFPIRQVTCEQVASDAIPLAFPLHGALCYDGSNISVELGIGYTPLETGMSHTIHALRPVIPGGRSRASGVDAAGAKI